MKGLGDLNTLSSVLENGILYVQNYIRVNSREYKSKDRKLSKNGRNCYSTQSRNWKNKEKCTCPT